MIITTCNGCSQRIANDDPAAARRVQLGPGELVDWCGGCVAIIQAELPRLVAELRHARRATVLEPVHQRAMRIWEPGHSLTRDADGTLRLDST